MNLHIRPVTADDRNALGALLRRLPVFEPHEIGVAEELLEETLAGSADYVINIAEDIGDAARGATAGPLIGYVCHGHNPVTDGLYDVYWVAVDPAVQGRGVGRALIAHAESCVREVHGRGIVIDTSSRAEYAAARRLYEGSGYHRVAEIPDFYKPGDALLMYMKLL